MPDEEIEEAKELLTKLYLDLLSYKKDNIQQKENKREKDKQTFKNFTIIELINFLSNYIKSLLEIKNNESMDEESDEKPLYKQYEELLIKAESDIRKHIKVSIYIYI